LPFSYVVYKEYRLVVSTGTGRVTCAEIKARQDQTRSDPDFNADFNQIVDLRTASAIGLTVDEVRWLSSRTIFSPRSRRAFIAATPAVIGMERMWEAYTEIAQGTSQIRLFSDLASALDWLGLGNILDVLDPTA
jgi:hypothetical protein